MTGFVPSTSEPLETRRRAKEAQTPVNTPVSRDSYNTPDGHRIGRATESENRRAGNPAKDSPGKPKTVFNTIPRGVISLTPADEADGSLTPNRPTDDEQPDTTGSQIIDGEWGRFR